MDLQERLKQTVELVKEIKTAWVDSKPENTDLAIYLHFWRGDEIVAAVQTALDRDVGLQAGALGAMGFGADVMSIAFESYYSTLVNSPITGEPWLHRELQFVYETHPEAHAEGWVDSCISIAVHERGGEYAFLSVPYVIEDDQVVWTDGEQQVSSAHSEEQARGPMFEYLQQVMSSPTIADRMAEGSDDQIAKMMAGLIDDDEARLFHTDMATLKALEDRGLITGIMFGAEKGSNRAQWLQERLGPEQEGSIWTEVDDADVEESS